MAESIRASGGGCMCGAVRLRAVGEPTGVVYCHCRYCRATSDAPVSSFCPDCGTPLSYEDEGLPRQVYVRIGVFDDPEAFEPEVHDWVSQRLR